MEGTRPMLLSAAWYRVKYGTAAMTKGLTRTARIIDSDLEKTSWVASVGDHFCECRRD